MVPGHAGEGLRELRGPVPNRSHVVPPDSRTLCKTVQWHAEEGVTLEAGAMDTLGKVAGGDMRKAITTLQSAVRLRVRSDLRL